MKILKFGGTSLENSQRLRNVAEILEKELSNSEHPRAVVVSAFGGVTNSLLEISTLASRKDAGYEPLFEDLSNRHIETITDILPASSRNDVLVKARVWLNELRDLFKGVALVGEITPRTLDDILSHGERLSALTLSALLQSMQIDAEMLDAREILITDSEHGNAVVDYEQTYRSVRAYFGEHPALQIVTGFIASSAEGATTTLGRGGSDYTASLLGAILGADEIEIWTDVDGVMTADPRKVKAAFALPHMTYKEAMELSHFGAKVIHPPSLQPALARKIPLRIKNTFNPDDAGTLITAEVDQVEHMVTGISSIPEVALLRLQGSGMVGVAGVSKRLFGVLAENKISVILITQASSEHTICFAIKPEQAELARKIIDKEFELEFNSGLVDPVIVETELSVVSAVGENMRHTPGVAARLFSALARNGTNVVAIAQGSSERNISVVTANTNEAKALNALHEEFFLSDLRCAYVFICGVGLIGSTLIEQISKQQIYLAEELSLDLKVVGVSNSKKLRIDPDGLDLSRGADSLFEQDTEDGGAARLVEKIEQLNLPASIFVDCTASDDAVEAYPKLLDLRVPVVAANKRAFSGDYKQYSQLTERARKFKAPLLYETSVGAGLPIISTLGDLRKSGDHVERIEAVLSGTLSYIFNSFNGEVPFSQVVKEAQELGYTEPDPRDDLNGVDVARKILILGREAGIELEPSDIEVENLVPEECRQTKSLEEFYTLLAKHDGELTARYQEAQKSGEKLCYLASIDSGKSRVSLEQVSKEHPFYSLSGSDNIISFTTTRYKERPLVVKGPGAGAEVTAAGVFADILKAVAHGDS